MLHAKVKIEKPDLETANARNRLDAVLQGLLEKSDVDREQMDEDSGKATSDALSKDSSPTAPGKRPSARFSHHRRKKRKEADDGLAEGGQQKQNTYVIKLFDRSVDLAQFSESTPLYPICRAWMRNSPMVREQERSPSPTLPTLPEDEEVPKQKEPHLERGMGVEGLNGKGQDVHKLPPPTPCHPNASGDPVNLRIPASLEPEEESKEAADAAPDSVPSMSSLIYKNMERWKKIRQRWKEASHKNQLRYTESMKILKEMYERQ
ncbi:protein lin-37 homolog isoform X1 [Sphaerodactylus townsendi]|uniref:protein lin-37 homolog isoform X1 n=1 Tax=Sphaerodactylus townsendi TaxID=933632 RepID=UPI0020270E46|nr:protein lin-37 homolog isoform X1 [Sphaerodactylus townsendi]